MILYERFLSLVLILTIGLGVIVHISMVPKASILIFLLLSFLILLSPLYHSKRKLTDNFSQADFNFLSYQKAIIDILLFFVLVISFILINTYFFSGGSPLSNVARLTVLILASIFIITYSNLIESFIRHYIIFVFIMSVVALVIYFLIASGFLDYQQYFVDLSSLSRGSFNRDKGYFGAYSAPYLLNFILIGSGKLSFAGLDFYRMSAWMHEPTFASLFISPAFLILLFKKNIIENNKIRIIFLQVILFHILVLASVAAYIGLLIVISLYILFNKWESPSTIFALGVVLLFTIGIVYYDLHNSSYEISSLLKSKFGPNSESYKFMIERLFWFLNYDEFNPQIFYSSLIINLFLYYVIILAIKSIVAGNANIFAVIILYIAIHSFKGMQENIFMLPFLAVFYTMFSLLEAKEESFNGVLDEKK